MFVALGARADALGPSGGDSALGEEATGPCKITVTAGEGGSANTGEYWLREGEHITLTAHAADDHYFDRWEGDVAAQDAAKNPLTLKYDGEAHVLRAVFGAGKPSAGEPSLLAEKAVLWFDAAATSTVLTDDSGAVTNWISRDSTHKVAIPRAKANYLAPTYDATTYGQACVDFGTSGSMMDMQFNSTAFQTAFFCVKIEQKIDAWLIGDTSATVMHRGGKGEWKYSTYHNKINEAWQDGEKVMSPLLTTLMPDDDFYVFAVRMSSSCSTSYLTSGNADTRNGGRQLSEVILFGALTDEEIATVNSYLLRKWKADPALTVAGMPEQRGEAVPPYGPHVGFVKGQTYSFAAPKAITNDSQTLASNLDGWTLSRTDFSSASGSENEVSLVYDDMLGYATLTWNWSSWCRLPHPRGAWLPGRYRCLEYVEQGGGARIQTDIKLSPKTTDVVFTVGAKDNTFYATNSVPTDNGDQKWIGTDSGSEFAFGRIKNGWYISCMKSLYNDAAHAYSQSLGPLTVAISGGKWFFMSPDSETEYQSENYGDLSSLQAESKKLWLFHCGGIEGAQRWAPPGTRLYQVEIYEGTACVHKLIACARRRDNQPGFYDLVTGKFYTNTETAGELLAGPTACRFERGLSIILR